MCRIGPIVKTTNGANGVDKKGIADKVVGPFCLLGNADLRPEASKPKSATQRRNSPFLFLFHIIESSSDSATTTRSTNSMVLCAKTSGALQSAP
jgi:hypothetical protein